MAAVVDAERRESNDGRVGKTASRVVLGSMTDFAHLMNAYRKNELDLEGIAVRLASTPCRPIGMKHPADVALEMLAGRR